MALHLITGYAGQEHITSADQGAYNMGTFGEGEFVINRGSGFAATVVTNNSITIADGEAMMQGRYIKLPVGTSESVTIDNGTSGMKRKDLIVIRYSKNVGTGVETASLAVIKGTPDASSPVDPSYTHGTITDGNDLINEMPLYRVNLDGLNVDSLDTLFSIKMSMVDYMDNYQLPIATADRLGGVKKGTNINIDNEGKISVPFAGSSQAGLAKAGDGISAGVNGYLYLKDATASDIGGIILGQGLYQKTKTIEGEVKKVVGIDRKYNSSGIDVYLTQDVTVPAYGSFFGATFRSLSDNILSEGDVLIDARIESYFSGILFLPRYSYIDNGVIYVYGDFYNVSSTSQALRGGSSHALGEFALFLTYFNGMY